MPDGVLIGIASICEDFARRAQRSSVARSSAVKVTFAVGRPVRAMNTDSTQPTDF
jgi:hypothetical protein